MLAIFGIVLLLVAFAVFRWTLVDGVYRRYPKEQFLLVGASALLGLKTVLERPSVLHLSLFGVELIALALLIWYVSGGARFSRGELRLSVGDRFPDFSLPSSEGRLVDSRSVYGRTALYLFYRGPW